jgi:PAB-dependent poly(A)-specific ribonuclease subunit 2
MPYYWEPLLSGWPNAEIFEVGHLPTKTDPGILAKARPNEVGTWLPNPRTSHRNQIERTRPEESNGASITPPKFLSEKARGIDSDKSPEKAIEKVGQALADTMLGKATKTEVPAMYGNVEIKYSSWGVEDFDFG